MCGESLRSMCPEYEVRVFGSRVRGTAKPFSDLDLAVMTGTPLDIFRLASLKEAFVESDLPFKVDVLDWQDTSPEFQAIVNAHCETIRDPDEAGESRLMASGDKQRFPEHRSG